MNAPVAPPAEQAPSALAALSSADWVRRVELVLVPTFRCNLRCAHCYVGCRGRGAEMGRAAALGLVDSARRLGLRALQVTGGEPLLWPHHRELIAALRSVERPAAISTNGTLLDEGHTSLLRGSRISLGMSLDGPASSHDALRGAGNHARVLRAAALAAREGVRFELTFTVTKRSLGAVPETVARAIAIGATGITLSPLERLGGRSDGLDDALDDDGYVELLAILAALRERTPEGFRLRSRNVGLRVRAVTHPCSVCACWGEQCPSQKFWPNRLFVLPDGAVLPQSQHLHRRYALGNAFDRGLEAVLAGYWGSARHQAFQTLCRHVYQDIIFPSERPFFFWDELLRQASARSVGELPVHRKISHPYDHRVEIAQARARGELGTVRFPLGAE